MIKFLDGPANDKKRFGRRIEYGTYRVTAEQPSEDLMRDNERWAEWCHSQKTMFA